MPERQLNLFAMRSVLCERFDSAFFRSIPRRPGVYLMSDARERIIYVGKAKDLRARLGSYRHVRAECSRKTARLVACVAQIRWQTCASEEAALLEENRLLRELRPRFNRMNTWPKASRFVRIADVPGGIELSLSAENTGECYGAFKGASRQNFGALLRLLSCAEADYIDLPRQLLCDRAPSAFAFPTGIAARWLDVLRDFLRGDCDRLLQMGRTLLRNEDPFYAAFRAADLAAAEHFFRIGPQRNFWLRRHYGAGANIILPEELDDWIVRGRNSQREAGSANAT